MARQFALLIGVNDYTLYEQSTNATPGSARLNGALEDVKTWWRICRRLGVAPEDIQVRTWPTLHPLELELESHATQCGPATAADIQAGVRWLGQALAAPDTAGIVVFAGHGGVVDGHPCVCPSDTQGAALANALPLKDLKAALDAVAPHRTLTVVLDACHGGSAQRGRTRYLGAFGDSTPIPPDPTDALVLASEVGKPSSERVFAQRHQGTFTWAASTVLGQWNVRSDAEGRFFDICARDLCRRARALLDALDDEQNPTYAGDPHDGSLAIGRVRAARKAADTCGTPDLSDGWRELWGGNDVTATTGVKFYRIFDETQQTPLGWVVVNTASTPDSNYGPTYAALSENWIWNSGSWPQASFWLLPQSSPPLQAPTPTPGSTYGHGKFLQANQWSVPTNVAGYNVGYANAAPLAWVAQPATAGAHVDWYGFPPQGQPDGWLIGGQPIKFFWTSTAAGGTGELVDDAPK